jgi:hypothetical protein
MHDSRENDTAPKKVTHILLLDLLKTHKNLNIICSIPP